MRISLTVLPTHVSLYKFPLLLERQQQSIFIKTFTRDYDMKLLMPLKEWSKNMIYDTWSDTLNA
jgi:hypothetical protein